MSKLLIHIGYAKAGSTTLQNWFPRHPQLLYKPGALNAFNDVYEIGRLAVAATEQTCEYYVTSFEDFTFPIGSAGDLPIQNGFRDYAYNWNAKQRQARACKTLQCLFQDGRILIVTRGVKGSIQSIYSQNVRGGGIAHPQELILKARSLLVHWTDFDFLIQLYRDAFGSEQVLVLPYELMRDDSATFFAVLQARLGLDHYEIEVGRHNPSLSPQELYWYPILSNAVSAVAWRLGKKNFARIYRPYVHKTLHNQLSWLVRILNRIKPGKITDDDFLWDEILPCCKGKATLLQNDPLYAPYASEYLWDV